jgi:hypothetical protein
MRRLRKALPNLVKLEEPEEANRVGWMLVHKFWDTKNPAKRAAIREHLLEAANDTAGMTLSLSGHYKEWALSRERLYRRYLKELEPNASPPQQRYFSNKLYNLHGKTDALQTEDAAREKLKGIRADDRYYQRTGMGYRVQEWGDLWYIYFRLNTGMMDQKTGRFV